ncbi:transcription-repair coupling factor [Candidatus Magnetomonas plexicatena]|uniref:transcription-repair coupling factor n=1 Tax=Candidatus Magnetomonas plexicatena TaxID=2552947 RepID=UPI001C74C820|nr:transcription-repair coupling factor [Nitrospirales bacterium LBB_01]
MSVKDLIEKRLAHCLTKPLPQRVYNLKGSLLPLLLALTDEPFMAVTDSEEEAVSLFEGYSYFSKLMGKPSAIYFPESLDAATSGKQIEILLNAQHDSSFILTLASFTVQVADRNVITTQSIVLRAGEEFPREYLNETLSAMGYKRAAMVVDEGEFSIRNYIFDIFPPGRKNPVRVEFFGDEIDSVRAFDADTQKTIEKLDSETILPLTQGGGTCYLFETFDTKRLFFINDAKAKGTEFITDIKNAPPYTILSSIAVDTEGIDAGALSLNGLGVLFEERKSISELPATIQAIANSTQVMMVSKTVAQSERLRELFAEATMDIPLVAEQKAFSDYEGNVFVVTGALNGGFYLDGLLVLTELELFGEVKRPKKYRGSTKGEILRTADDLKPGDYIVHNEHGIGLFEELRRESAEDFNYDMLAIQYADGARLYVPVYGIEQVKKYRASEGVTPRLDKLGGKTWAAVKRKVRKNIEELAQKLIAHYAQREITPAFAVSVDSHMHQEFDTFFPYEPTQDQLSATEEIKRSMESDKPMDRLLCGDVGYGKTEVAMRAAFKAVFDSKQVMVLVPTTILCEQHYMTFKERFSPFPVSVDYVSRFKTKVEIEGALLRASKGEVDILIGTQALLSKKVDVPNLALLIIDEEHRFGVAQKEKIKELKRGVHCLTLSATPIPRTLQMSLSGIWTMSTIETPPEERQAVRTFVISFDKNIIKEAIGRELHRHGQVFFVHNRISDIDKYAAMVKSLFPDSAVAVAHGQMHERELEDKMLKFMKHEIDVLVSTSIIGSGIDVPSANTIIVNRADMMGLADLYQLRGRVGRSNVRAYAYLITPSEDAMTGDAKKRMMAIQELSYLGAGLRLAMRDMEIRGAGNLLGPQQSGHIYALGFDTYMELLEEEVAKQRGTFIEREFEPTVDLRIQALIPEDYIEDVGLRLNFYRRVAAVKDEDALIALKDEMRDRFGAIPDVVENLLGVVRVKQLCRALKIELVKRVGQKIVVTASEDAALNVENLQKLGRVKNIKFLKSGFEFSPTDFKKDAIISELIELFMSFV